MLICEESLEAHIRKTDTYNEHRKGSNEILYPGERLVREIKNNGIKHNCGNEFFKGNNKEDKTERRREGNGMQKRLAYCFSEVKLCVNLFDILGIGLVGSAVTIRISVLVANINSEGPKEEVEYYVVN